MSSLRSASTLAFRLVLAAVCGWCAGGSALCAHAQAPKRGNMPYWQLGPRPGTTAPTPGQQPHPAVARIIVPEGEATSYGSGTLVDVRDEYGLVVTNWHVVRDARGRIEVVFPDGFRSFGQALKIDRDWDLAALVIWRPNVEPVKLATAAPQPGDVLTIAGYGQGTYRAITGRCTKYLAPSTELPREMVEVSVAARQGDSGGPILNSRGELAGVLWGAGDSTTLGSYIGRVGGFLASVAPHLATPQNGTQVAARLLDAPPLRAPLVSQTQQADTGTMVAVAAAPTPRSAAPADGNGGEREQPETAKRLTYPDIVAEAEAARTSKSQKAAEPEPEQPDRLAEHGLKRPMFRTEFAAANQPAAPPAALAAAPAEDRSEENEASDAAAEEVLEVPLTWQDIAGQTLFEQAKTVLAALGVFAVLHFFLRHTGG